MAASPRPRLPLLAGGTVSSVLDHRGRIAAAVPILFVAVLGAEAVKSPKTVIELVAALAFAALVFWRLLAGLVLFTIITFPAHLPGGLGAGATLAKPLGLLIAGVWVLAFVRDREMPLFVRDRPAVATALIGYLLWGLISSLWADDPARSTSLALRLAQVVILFFVVYSAVRTPRDARILAGAYVAAASVTSAYVLASGRTYEGRLTGGLDPNFLAAELVPALLIGGFLLGTTRRAAHRLLLLGALGLVFVVFALTQSRGGAIALGVALVAAILVAGPARPVVVATVVAGVGLAAVYYAIIAPARVRERVTSISENASSGRTDTWQIAGQIALDHPVAGVGLGNFPVVEPSYLPKTLNLTDVRQILAVELVVHNTYLETLAELGIVGLVLLLLPIGSILLRALGGLRRARAPARDAGTTLVVRGLVAGIAGLLVGYVFLSAEYEKQLWLLLGLAAACAAILDGGRRGTSRLRSVAGA